MKVFLLSDVENVGMAHEIVKVSDGFARNSLFPRKLALEVTVANESSFAKRTKVIEHRKDVICSKTSMLAQRISGLNLKLERKLHDDGKLYGSVKETEVVELLAKHGVSVSKNQIDFGKSIKAKGTYEVTVKLSSDLQPKVTLNIVGA